MNEFEEKDYESARNYASAIKGNADNIQGIFDDIDGVMSNLYGENWESLGAENSHERYNTIRKNYEVFYNQVVAMQDHVLKVTAANEEADTSAGNVVSGV